MIWKREKWKLGNKNLARRKWKSGQRESWKEKNENLGNKNLATRKRKSWQQESCKEKMKILKTENLGRTILARRIMKKAKRFLESKTSLERKVKDIFTNDNRFERRVKTGLKSQVTLASLKSTRENPCAPTFNLCKVPKYRSQLKN